MKTVTIIGCAEGWQNAPSDGECWGITNIILRRDVTQHFDMHDLTWDVQQWYDYYQVWVSKEFGRNFLIGKARNRVEQMPSVFKRVNQLGIPLYSTRTYDDVPTSVAYPLDVISAHFSERYFASTFDYAIAKAIYDEYDRIDLYGVKMSSVSEYAHQLKSAHFWLGVAKGLGIAYRVHGESELFKTKSGLIYGYNEKM